MFKKKFKVRVSHFSSGKYTVDYAYYRFIPIWNSFTFWFNQGHPGGTECWSTDMWDYNTAEKIASKIKTIEDVSTHHEPEVKKMQAWKKAEAEWWNENAPYQSKKIL
jgi:hypothetical protein